MNKKELLKQILDDFPEFEEDKKSLEKTIDFMVKKNPNIEIDKKFKKNLWEKIQSISDLKMNKKRGSFWFFAIPSFSFVFIITGVFYIYKDMIFKNFSAKNINIEKTYKYYDSYLWEDYSQEVWQEKESWQFDEVWQENESYNKNTELDYIKKIENTSENTAEKTEKDNFKFDKKNDLDEKMLENLSWDKWVKKENIKKAEEVKITGNTRFKEKVEKKEKLNQEKTKEVEEKSKPEENIESNYRQDYEDIKEKTKVIWEDFSDSHVESLGRDFEVIQTFSLEEKKQEKVDVLDFSDFCRKKSGVLLKQSSYRICKVLDKFCLESSYKSWDCDWLDYKLK